MKILLITPLYPPDIEDPAPYVKELATRMRSEHEVSILAYGHIPERIAGVEIIAIEKSALLPVRLMRFCMALFKSTRGADVVYAQNGPSTELPIIFISHLTRTPFIIRLGDEAALRFAKARTVLHVIQRVALWCADAVIVHREALLSDVGNKGTYMLRPHIRPEILPFSPHPTDELAAYELSWKTHIQELTTLCTHVST